MYEMLINIILIHKSIIFFKYQYFLNYNQKTDFFVTTPKFLKYNIDSQSFENLDILNILNTSYRSNYILPYAVKILYFS